MEQSDIYRVRLLPHQLKFYKAVIDRHIKEVIVSGGIGSGKTWIGAFTFAVLSSMYDSPGLICANSYSQLRDSTLKQAQSCWEGMGFNVEINEHKTCVILDGKEHFYRTLENPEVIRGI
jgi:hypothetical protein